MITTDCTNFGVFLKQLERDVLPLTYHLVEVAFDLPDVLYCT